MRMHRLAAIGVAAALAAGSPLAATAQSAAAPDGSYRVAQQSYADVIVGLENTGYRVVDMRSTFLGRLRIRAQNREHMREVIVSRSTGEIMSDQIIKVFVKRGDGAAKTATRTTNETSEDTIVSTSSNGVSVKAGSSGASASAGGTSVSAGGGGISIGN